MCQLSPLGPKAQAAAPLGLAAYLLFSESETGKVVVGKEEDRGLVAAEIWP